MIKGELELKSYFSDLKKQIPNSQKNAYSVVVDFERVALDANRGYMNGQKAKNNLAHSCSKHGINPMLLELSESEARVSAPSPALRSLMPKTRAKTNLGYGKLGMPFRERRRGAALPFPIVNNGVIPISGRKKPPFPKLDLIPVKNGNKMALMITPFKPVPARRMPTQPTFKLPAMNMPKQSKQPRLKMPRIKMPKLPKMNGKRWF